ncbi:unnamed protein product [Psylliodes chrysocephalus]|uniref:HTH psq-type domain-containing protein n=1 Tax=Psylliodes chrysocephalus TaxID=3402493 RepID=A0A9P0D5H3_9CUCU|nr:unnamed protein product [Psylliodes chrysocephala]
MSAKATKRPLRSLTAHEKLDAIRRVHDGESKASVARDIGVPESTLRGWCKNEDKISYLSRQSSPETDESLDHIANKKPKLEEPHQPFNLSMKTHHHNSYTPTPPVITDANDSANILLNLNTDSTPKSSLSERERNRAELARLSIELGLNRPEMFIPNLNTSLTLNDFSSNISLLAQWNALLAQQQQLKALQSNNKPTKIAESSNAVSSSNNNGLHTEHDLPKDIHSVQESVWYWLKSQQSVLNVPVSTTSSTSNGVSTPIVNTLPSSSNGINSDQSSWFWKWYKQFGYKEQETKNILYQQLTKEASQKEPVTLPIPPIITDQQNAENLSMRDTTDNRQKENDKTGIKVRSVLDNLLFNNNNNDNLPSDKNQSKEDDDTLSQSEAVEHGEKFLKWLESCSDPSVTAVQIMQFKTLLNNVKSGVDRKNCDLQNKAKVKRK